MKKVAPGVYSDDVGDMHLDLSELLVANGYADTAENRQMILDVALEQFGDLGIPVAVIEDDS